MEKTKKKVDFKNETVCVIPMKDGKEELRIRLSEFKGQARGDFRVFTEIDGEMRATKQGFVVDAGKWAEFRKGIAKLDEKITTK